MKFIPGNAQHIGAREAQQDAFAFSDLSEASFLRHGGVLALVADGIGGLDLGDAASRAAIAAFLAAYQAKRPDEPIPEALKRSAAAANQAVFESGERAGKPGDIGTTLVAAVAHNASLYWFAIGDSPLLLLRDGELTFLTREHTFEAELLDHVRTGELTLDMARRHPERESLTTYVGAPRLGPADRTLRPFPLEPGDCVILASDGLTKTLSSEEIVAEFDGNTAEFCERLVKKVLEKGRSNQDNVTVISLLASAEDEVARAEAPTITTAQRRGRRRLAWAAAAIALFAGTAFWVWRQWICCADLPAPATPPVSSEPAPPSEANGVL
ncbi:MAG: serine/threonine-protein phosphatase [Bryobacteraceae bacterium]|nr:serine/threonine-protein phosphatase [Bryobacteraceae bacterium]